MLPTSITRFLSRPLISLLAILVALVNKCWISFFYNSMVGDKSLYILMTENAMYGHGFTETLSFLNHSGNPFYITNQAIQSPLYSVLLIIPLWITNHNLFLSVWSVDVLSWAVFLFAIRAILKQGSVPIHIINLATLLIGFFIYPHETSSGPKDTLAIGLLLWAVFYFMKLVQKENSTIADSAGLAVFIVLAGLVKFLYVPVALLLLVAVLFVNLLVKHKLFSGVFFQTLLFTGICWFFFWIWFKQTAHPYPQGLESQVTKAWQMGKVANERIAGFFPGNLKQVYPFVPASFLDLEFFGTQLSQRFHISTSFLSGITWWINFILTITLLFIFIKLITEPYKKQADQRKWFALAGGLISLAIIAALCLMSVRYKALIYKGGSLWTYATEAREYLFIMVFLQLLFILYVGSGSTLLKSSLLQKAKYVLVLVFSLQSLHGLYFSGKQFLYFEQGKISRTVSVQEQILNSINDFKKDNPSKKISVVTQASHLRWLSLLKSYTTYCNPELLQQQQIPLLPNETRISVIYKEDIALYADYLKQSGVTIWKEAAPYVLIKQE